MSKKVVTSGRLREGGRSAVYKEDFKYHTDGDGWRHTANQTDMNPPVPDPSGGTYGLTVQETLETIAGYLAAAGSGYVTIGPIGSNADYIADPLEQAFSDAFSDPRLSSGGVILVRSGQYSLTDTVTVPPGITIMGEPNGTYIYGHTAEKSMFHISKYNIKPRIGDNGGDLFASEGLDKIRFYNLVLGDNTDEAYLSSGNPVPTMTTVPMIEAEVGSNLDIERVTFLAYYRGGFGVTKRAISYAGSSFNATLLDINHCVFDGFFGTIEFVSGQGPKDILRVNKNRVYMFNDTSTSLENDAFVSFNLCNASFEGNHIEFIQSNDGICFGLTSSPVPDPDKCSVNIINNTGTPIDVNVGYNRFFVNEFTSNTRILLLGNNFGSRVNNDYFFIIGDGVSSVGDLTGPNALDLAINRLNSSGANKPTIILNVGEYTLSESIDSKDIRLYGNSGIGGVIVHLDADSTAQDIAGNNTQYLGGNIENIEFIPVDSSSFQSVTVSSGPVSSDRDQLIKNCKFVNCGLYFENPTLSNNAKLNRNVINCSFFQDDTYDNNLSFYSGQFYNNLVLDGCSFDGYGYAVGVGYFNENNESGPSGFKRIDRNLKINNCKFILNNGPQSTTIDQLSPLNDNSYTGEFNPNKYIFIYNDAASIVISNTIIKCVGDTEWESAVIDSSILEKTKFDSLIKIKAYNILLDNVFATGTNQLFKISGDDYQLPIFNLTPINKLDVINCNMIGSLPIYVNDRAFTYPSGATQTRGMGYSVNISDCKFTTFNSDTIITPSPRVCTLIGMTLKDIAGGNVTISNCNIIQNFGKTVSDATNYKNYPIENFESFFDGIRYKFGTVLIDAPNWDINVSNCSISSITYDDFIEGNLAYTGLYASNISTNAQIGYPRVSIENNNITTVGGVDGDTATYFYSLATQGYIVNVNNNMINTNGLSSVSDSYLGNLAIGPYGYGQVYGNTFIWDDIVFKQQVYLDSDDGGIFKNNIFGSSIGIIPNDIDSRIFCNDKWLVTDNKNQRVDITVPGCVGSFKMGEEYSSPATAKDCVVLADFASVYGFTNVYSNIYTDSSGGTVGFHYEEGSSPWSFAWEIQIEDIIPLGGGLHSAILNYTSTSLMDAGEIGIILRDDDGDIKESESLITNDSGQLIVQGPDGGRFKSGFYGKHYIIVYVNEAESSLGPSDIEFSLSIRYQW